MAQNTELGKPSRPGHEPGTPEPATGSPRSARRRGGLWIVAIAAIVVAFLLYQTPPYFSLDMARSRIPVQFPAHYWLLVGHVVFGTVALVTMCMQLWPWLRVNHPAVHRWSGRIYVFGGALPTAFFAVVMFPVIPPAGSLGVVMSALLWSATAILGWRAARRGAFAAHRKWMIYSFAIVWGAVIWSFGFGLPLIRLAPDLNPVYIIEGARWIGWVANLVIAHWWLERTADRPLQLPGPAARAA